MFRCLIVGGSCSSGCHGGNFLLIPLSVSMVVVTRKKIGDLRQAAVEFLDNGAGAGDEACSFCQGPKDPASSVNPTKAIISLVNNRGTEYGTYIAVQNELVAAYNQLRDREAQRMYGTTFTKMEKDYNDPQFNGDKDALKERIDIISDMIPQKLSEAEPTS